MRGPGRAAAVTDRPRAPSRPRRVIVFYISGHGFGHASRVIEVINAVAAAGPDAALVVRTSAARWLFDVTVRGRIEFHAADVRHGRRPARQPASRRSRRTIRRGGGASRPTLDAHGGGGSRVPARSAARRWSSATSRRSRSAAARLAGAAADRDRQLHVGLDLRRLSRTRSPDAPDLRARDPPRLPARVARAAAADVGRLRGVGLARSSTCRSWRGTRRGSAGEVRARHRRAAPAGAWRSRRSAGSGSSGLALEPLGRLDGWTRA